MKYINPVNGYETTDGSGWSWLWVLLFGPIYFGVRGNWGWVFFHLLMGMLTFGVSYLIVPFFIRKINRTHLLRAGYKPVTEEKK